MLKSSIVKSMIAGIAALSLTFATVAPVQAEPFTGEDVGKLLIGFAAIAALNAALENNKRDSAPATQTRDQSHRAPQAHGRHDNRWSNLNRGNGRWVLPSTCMRDVQTRFGTVRMFGQRCLEQNYRQVNSLPDRCAVRVYTGNGPRRGFDPLCLRDAGYTSDRRR
ncbi:hypothetical protein [Yoonia sp.]|uniref:hypothetical protein n=1 Tax=Yoonia sp. TaxID=2212373 RepID=UPI0025CEA831|nr:hypothetical protein [Yoonia sp.]